ncbi:hypothetical protein ID866_7467 [Astraeus odoratus]|nr:hypothetical protein ID866_7467 [Astraeus odoratus]
MPKRVPTPPPADDEPKYLCVVHPYAREGYCNMELSQDRQDFALWVACCIDKDAFFAVFHKPSARDTVIIEVNRDYQHFDRILGEHRWSEFLKKPSAEEKDRVTRVYYCTYNTGRMVQKYGWKRIYVEESWFKGWSPNNGLITYPYPPTHFCDVPVEDATSQPLCRPLPGATKPPALELVQAPKPVVGSSAWTISKECPAIAALMGSPAKGASKQRDVPDGTTPPAKTNVSKPAKAPAGVPNQVKGPAIGGGHFVVKSSNILRPNSAASATGVASSPGGWDSSPSTSGRSTPARRTDSSADSSASVNQLPAAPPGLPPRKNAWSKGPPVPSKISTTSNPPLAPDRTANTSSASSWSTGTPTSASASASSPDTEPSSDVGGNNMVHIQISESFEEEFHGVNIKEYRDPDAGLAELDAVAPGAWDQPIAGGTWETANTGGWDDVPNDAESQWTESQKDPEKQLCNVHGVICKKGICLEYAKQVRAAKRAKEMADAEKERASRGKKNNRGRGAANRGRGRGSDPASGANVQSNPFRGSGAPLKTNWRGAPRTIVSANAIEQREAVAQAEEPIVSGWGEDDEGTSEPDGPTADNAATEVASNDGWNITEASYDPWAVEKPMSWADQVEAECTAVANRKDSKRGGRRQPRRGRP